MSKYLLLLIVTVLWFKSDCILAQGGNLEFSRVLIVNNSPVTVPNNKVWKVVGAFPNTGVSNNQAAFDLTILVNGQSRIIGHSGLSYKSDAFFLAVTMEQELFIHNLWFPENYTIAAGPYIGELSILEFSIIP